MEFNPFAYDFHQDPHPTYAWLRENAPVYYNPDLDFWALSRFTDVLEALHDYRTYSSAEGITIEDRAATAGDGDGPLRSMLELDPPMHTALRQIIARRFSPRQIAGLEPLVRNTTRSLLDQLGGRDGFDIVGEFSALLPTTVVATMLGFPVERHDDLRIWTEAVLHRQPGNKDVTPAGVDAISNMMMLSAQVVAERRRSPGEDLLSSLVQSEVDGRPPTDAEMLGFCLVLITGGHETTSKLIANGIRLFRSHPSQRQLVAEDPERMRPAVEELLRFSSPTQYMARTTTRDVELHGTTIPEGARVALLLGCGNRDPREFDRPEEFDITRRNARILAFGHGAHVCLGAAVARLEGRVALQEFLTRFPDYEVDESGVELLHSGNVHGPSKVPVSVA